MKDDLTPQILGTGVVHHDATTIGRSPLHVVTPARQWAYAATFPVRGDDPVFEDVRAAGARIIVHLSVLRGRVGIGITNSTGDAFLVEKFVTDRRRTSLILPPRTPASAVVMRNASDSGPSEFIVTALRADSLADALLYPVRVAARDFDDEAIPRDGDSKTVFDTDAARTINSARLDWLTESDLIKRGCRVLDTGAGVGHFLPFYTQRGCTVVALDGRRENIAELQARFPSVDAYVADVQRLDPASLGRFDAIHCFGLLYHLESPIAALRVFRKMCDGILILETMVCDSAEPVCVLADETKAASQALDGLGCRPSPAFLALALGRVGFRYVYGANPPPRHEDFRFEWRNDLETVRDGHPLRCVFVASDEPLESSCLVPVLD